MGQLFIGGITKSPEQVEAFNRLLRFNRQIAVELAVDKIKAEVLAARKRREWPVRPKPR
jgi:hypothetical protein